MSLPIDTKTVYSQLGTHNFYWVRVLNVETIMDADCGYDCFDLPISEVYSRSTARYLGYVMFIGLGTYIVKTESTL